MYASSLGNYALHFYIVQGMTPFMSWAILMAESGMHAPVKHRPVHDIESIFYVMLYFCMQFKGPGIRRMPKDIKALMPFVFNDWFLTNLTFQGMADEKWTDPRTILQLKKKAPDHLVLNVLVATMIPRPKPPRRRK
jgi:hypothetical protein